MLFFDAARVLIPFVVSFAVGIATAPVLAHYLYTYKAWKKKGGKGKGLGDDNGTPLFDSLHKEREVSTPRLGGILVWGSVFATAIIIAILGLIFGYPFTQLDFVNRGQTWLPLFALIVGGLTGLVDDVLEIRSSSGGLSMRWRLLIVAIFGAFAGWWFYAKLGVSTVGVPLFGAIPLGGFFILFFVFVTLVLYASGVIDGIDDLAGRVYSIIFMAYSGIAFCPNVLIAEDWPSDGHISTRADFHIYIIEDRKLEHRNSRKLNRFSNSRRHAIRFVERSGGGSYLVFCYITLQTSIRR